MRKIFAYAAAVPIAAATMVGGMAATGSAATRAPAAHYMTASVPHRGDCGCGGDDWGGWGGDDWGGWGGDDWGGWGYNGGGWGHWGHWRHWRGWGDWGDNGDCWVVCINSADHRTGGLGRP
jgi:hypothetical protein